MSIRIEQEKPPPLCSVTILSLLGINVSINQVTGETLGGKYQPYLFKTWDLLLRKYNCGHSPAENCRFSAHTMNFALPQQEVLQGPGKWSSFSSFYLTTKILFPHLHTLQHPDQTPASTGLHLSLCHIPLSSHPLSSFPYFSNKRIMYLCIILHTGLWVFWGQQLYYNLFHVSSYHNAYYMDILQ